MANFFTRLNTFYDQVDLLATQEGCEEWAQGLVALAAGSHQGKAPLDFVIAILETRSQDDLRRIDLSIWSDWLEAAPSKFTLHLQRLALRRQHGPLFEEGEQPFDYHLKSARRYITDLLQEFRGEWSLERQQEELAFSIPKPRTR